MGGLGGHPRSPAMSPFDRVHTTSDSTLIETMRQSCTIVSYSELFVKSRQFYPTPPAFGTPLWVTLFEFRGDLWRKKLRVPGLSCGVAHVIQCLAVLIQYRRVSDGQTDTDDS